MPNDMWRDIFGCQAGASGYRTLNGLFEQVVYPFTRQCLAPGIGERHGPHVIPKFFEPGF